MRAIQTHDGLFHADEVFACALLKIIFPKVEIIRSREIDFSNPNIDAYIDVGGRYDNVRFFDHHYRGFREMHNEKIPKAAFGLVYDKFAQHIINDVRVIGNIRNSLVIPIDAHDNNIRVEGDYRPYTVSNIISAFNPSNSNDNTERFFDAINFATTIFDNCLQNAVQLYQDEEFVREVFDRVPSNRHYVLFDRYVPYVPVYNSNYEKYRHINYIVFRENDHYRAVALRDKDGNMKAPFPSEWGGLENEELSRVSQVPNSIFCHRGQFIASNKTLDGMIQMVNIASNQN